MAVLLRRASFLPARNLTAVLATVALVAVATEAYHRVLPLFVRAVGIPVASLGLAESLAAAVEAASSTPLGILADRVDRATVAGCAGLVLAAVLALFGLVGVTSTVGLVAVVVIVAVIRLTASNSLTPLVEETLSEQSGLEWGFYGAAVYLGGALGLGLAGLIVGETLDVGIRSVFLLVAPALTLGVAILWWVHPPSLPGWSELGGVELGATVPGPRDIVSAFGDVSRPRVLARLCLADALVTTGTSGTLFLLPLLAVDIGLTAQTFLIGFGASLLLGAGLSLVGGYLADRTDSKRVYVTNFVSEVAMLAAFALAGGAALFAVGVALYTVQTAFESGYIDYLFSLFSEDETGRVWGLNGSVNKVAGALGPAVGAVLYGVDPHLPFAGGAVLVGVGTVVAATMPQS